MHLKAHKLSPDTELAADFCIIGGGAAGCVLAHELAQSGKQVILLEAGGVKGPEKSMDLYEGVSDNPDFHLPPDMDRGRGLGGSSALWGGRCMPYDPIDFEARDHVPNSGWPVTYDQMRPWYERAQTYVDCGPYEYDSARSGLEGDLIEGISSSDLETRTLERWSPPTNFGKSLGPGLLSAPNVTVVTGAVATALAQDETGRITRVTGCAARNLRPFSVRAGQVILAGGGLETTRLLLATATSERAAIGDHSGWLGRGYMCHLRGVISQIELTPGGKLIFGYETDPEGVYVRRRFTLSAQAQRREGLTNLYALLDRPLLSDASHGSASLSMMYLLKRVLGKGSDEAIPESGRFALYKQHLRNLIFGAPEVLNVLPKFGRDRFLSGRRVPSLLLSSEDNNFHLQFHAEQSPIRDSAVTLGPQKDRTGLPQLHIAPQIHEGDIDAIARAHRAIDRELRASNVGKLSFLEDDIDAAIRACKCTLGHHIGTTRMARDPENGVVDENARVHGVPNLHIASASTFPTSGQAHPTLTILAFALRLADRLRDGG